MHAQLIMPHVQSQARDVRDSIMLESAKGGNSIALKNGQKTSGPFSGPFLGPFLGPFWVNFLSYWISYEISLGKRGPK